MPRKPALEGQELRKAVQMKKNGASYNDIAEKFEISKNTAYRNVKEGLEKQTKRSVWETERSEAITEREDETERDESESENQTENGIETKQLSETTFRKCLHLFIDGKNSEQIADHLGVPQKAVEYELLPYVNALKKTRKLQAKFEEVVQ